MNDYVVQTEFSGRATFQLRRVAIEFARNHAEQYKCATEVWDTLLCRRIRVYNCVNLCYSSDTDFCTGSQL